MKKNKMVLLALLAWPVLAQDVDLSFLKGLEAKAKEAQNIDLGPDQMSLLKSFTGGADLGGLTAGLKRVKVYTFEFDKEGMYNLADAENIRTKVKADAKWVSLISVKEKGGFTEIMTHRGPDGKSDGFLILAAEPRELTVVNLVGTLDITKVARMGGMFGIPYIETEKDKDKSKDKSKDE